MTVTLGFITKRPVVAFASFVQCVESVKSPAKPIGQSASNASVIVGVLPKVIVTGEVKTFLH